FSDGAGGTMAEVGLLPFARVALEVATQVLPPYRTRFSKHQFTQPQLLAVLCLMRYEDWTFREAETRLREHQELRAALKLREVPDYTTLYRFLRRLDDVTVERGLGETVRRLRRRRRRAVSVAIDGTGLSYNSVSTFFIRRLEQHADRSARHRHWLKWVIVVDVQQQILLAQRAHQGPGAEVSPKAPFGIKCSAPFRKNRTANAPRSKPSSRRSNASFPPALLGAAYPYRFAKPCCSVLPTTSIA